MKPSEQFIETLLKNTGWKTFHEQLRAYEIAQTRHSGNKQSLKKALAQMKKQVRGIK